MTEDTVASDRLATWRPADGAFVFADERGEARTPNGRPRTLSAEPPSKPDWPSH